MVGEASQSWRRYAHLLGEPDARTALCEPLTAAHADIGRRRRAARTLDARLRLDGFKIDFIDAIRPESVPAANAGYGSVGRGIYENTNSNAPCTMASRRYANLYRASDVPLNFD